VVDLYDADDPRDAAEVARAADVVMIAVPMAQAESVTAAFAPLVREDALLCDINSLKQGVCDVMAEHATSEAVGLHPMFGPTVSTLRRQKVVVCPVHLGPRAAWLHRELEQMGVEIIESDPQTHDRVMAAVQVLVHFSTLVMGEALRSTGLSIEETLRFTSPIYRLEIAFIGRLFAQNADLYAEIEMTNPHGDAFRRRFLEAAGAFSHAIGAGDREAFRKLFGHVREYFHGFSAESMRLSDFIIDTLVMQP
jgi:prephenate dehydrogenase